MGSSNKLSKKAESINTLYYYQTYPLHRTNKHDPKELRGEYIAWKKAGYMHGWNQKWHWREGRREREGEREVEIEIHSRPWIAECFVNGLKFESCL